MSGRAKRLVAVSGVAIVVGAGGVVLAAGSASAATPIVVGDCAATISGAPGTPLALSPKAVVAPAVTAVQAVPLVGPTLAGTVQSAISALPNIPLGAIPNGSGFISGGTIAKDVTGNLTNPILGPVLGAVSSALTQACGITTKGVNQAAGTVQDGAGQVANGLHNALNPGGKTGGQPGSGGSDPKQGNPGSTSPGTSPGTKSSPPPPFGSQDYQRQGFVGQGVPFSDSLIAQYGMAMSPQQRYGDIPFATPGLFAMSPGVRYGGQIPGYSPQFQALGTQQGDANNPVRTAGHAEAMPSNGITDGTVGLPLLLAVLGFAGASAALVRTWVLRKAAGSAS